MKSIRLGILALAICLESFGATNDFEFREGGIVRGPKDKKQIALEFTADQFAEGGKTILDELAKHHAKASFFFTGNFFTNLENKVLAKRIVKEGHYLGPHSDTHPLLCPWDGPKKTLVTKEFFLNDVEKNLKKIERVGVKRKQIQFWIPPYEHYNEEIVAWSRELGLMLINYTPGTRSNADYTEDNAKNFVSSKIIYDSILKKEQEDPNGLNGFLLLMHFGVGPKRTDKFYNQLGALLDELRKRGYEFVRVDELLKTNNKPPQFADFPTANVFRGDSSPVDLTSHPKARNFRTRLKEGAKQKPNFAGHYIAVEWGCGSGCQQSVIIDALTGKVYFLPMNSDLGSEFKLDSFLWIINPPKDIYEFYEGKIPETNRWTYSFYYLWDEKLKDFKLLFTDRPANPKTK